MRRMGSEKRLVEERLVLMDGRRCLWGELFCRSSDNGMKDVMPPRLYRRGVVFASESLML